MPPRKLLSGYKYINTRKRRTRRKKLILNNGELNNGDNVIQDLWERAKMYFHARMQCDSSEYLNSNFE